MVLVGGFGWLGDLLLDTLEYADDANFVDVDINIASRRITCMERGYREDAAMEISKPKTKVMHVRNQGEGSPVRPADIEAAVKKGLLPFECWACHRPFASKDALNTHLRTCGPAQRGVYEGEYTVEKVLDVRGTVENRFFQVRWAPQADGRPWPKDNPSWEPRGTPGGLHRQGE